MPSRTAMRAMATSSARRVAIVAGLHGWMRLPFSAWWTWARPAADKRTPRCDTLCSWPNQRNAPRTLDLWFATVLGRTPTRAVSLPNVLMEQARLAKDHAPRKAAIAAQLAAAIAILTFAPIRLGNLIKIELGQNLIKPGGLNTPYWLVFPNYDVKNRVDLNFKFDQPLTDLLDEYVHEFRPTLLRGANTGWLFPGEAGQPKHKLLFSKQITARVQKATGLRLTVHQFRHAAAAVYLKHRPGDYETVRRLLGHRDIQTTTRFYCGLQTMEATEQFGRLIREQINFES